MGRCQTPTRQLKIRVVAVITFLLDGRGVSVLDSETFLIFVARGRCHPILRRDAPISSVTSASMSSWASNRSPSRRNCGSAPGSSLRGRSSLCGVATVARRGLIRRILLLRPSRKRRIPPRSRCRQRRSERSYDRSALQPARADRPTPAAWQPEYDPGGFESDGSHAHARDRRAWR
jgi:hypothetical protein